LGNKYYYDLKFVQNGGTKILKEINEIDQIIYETEKIKRQGIANE